MAKIVSHRPTFVGEGWGSLPQGYKFLATPQAGAFQESSGANVEEWRRLLRVFDEARRGIFESLNLLPALVRDSEDFHVRSASLRILGDASPRRLVGAIAQAYEHPDVDTRFAAYSATAHTADLALARALAKASRKLNRGLELDLLADSISELLESVPSAFIEPRDGKVFQRAVEAKIVEIEHRVGRGQPVLFGRILSVQGLVDRIRAVASGDASAELLGLLEEYLSIFEAMTGVLYSDWFDHNGAIDPRDVLRTMDEFERSSLADRLEPGRRYFFGHLVPD